MAAFWSALERMPGLNAISSAWSSLMGPEFEMLKAVFFRKQGGLAKSYFCERCNCAHEVVSRGPEAPAPPAAAATTAANPPLVAVCRCNTFDCPDILLTPADIEIWELHWTRLGRTLCDSLGLDPQPDEFPFCNTRQIGCWPAGAVPVFLTIQTEPCDLRAAIAELGVRHQDPFILLTPTSAHTNSSCRQLLAHRKATSFPLDSTVILAEDGRLRPAKAPGELFAQFTPEPSEVSGDVAGAAMAIADKLDVGPPPTPLTVFRLYCGKGMSIPEIAKELGVSNATVFRRLEIIRAKTGKDPKDLRRLSPGSNGSIGEA